MAIITTEAIIMPPNNIKAKMTHQNSMIKYMQVTLM
jgi:hypothetical protein